MKRKRKDQYLVTADYSLGWRDNRERWAAGEGHYSEIDAIAKATSLTAEMRRDGAASAMRTVRIRQWEDGAELADAPELYRASYYDPEQKLTEAEAFAARVHDWHEFPDRFNSRQPRISGSPWMGYKPWQEDWGPKPTVCPACSAKLRSGPP
ncbi:Uncharacterised protein [Mycobacteroides abscessus subsp. abscessus]|nr:Uncharacterised protein [Mycobacteroides abscessus subsp. abscessus]SLD01584.1 Uncharacterised protein [Mycobacteroides abscessus subsp. abscessus]